MEIQTAARAREKYHNAAIKRRGVARDLINTKNNASNTIRTADINRRVQSVCVSQKACSTAIRQVKNVHRAQLYLECQSRHTERESALTMSVMNVANTLLCLINLHIFCETDQTAFFSNEAG